MKPRYTVRLTGDLAAAEREQVAQRVAGITDIESDKIIRLLERGRGRDLIKPSSANVANRLASVLAEAGAPVQLVAVEDETTAGATAAQPRHVTGDDGQDDVLRPRPAAVPRDGDPARGVGAQAGAPARAAGVNDEEDRGGVPSGERWEDRHTDQEPAGSADGSTSAGATAAAPPRRAEPLADRVPTAAPVPAPVPAPEPTPAPATEQTLEPMHAPATEPAPEPTPAPATEPLEPAPEPEQRQQAGLEAPDATDATPSVSASREPQPIEHPQRRARPRNGTAFLGAVGAAALGIGAFLALDFLLDPIAIGVLVLAALALVLSIAGQRRAIWLPGVGAMALLVWGLVNAEGGAVPSLAANWPWFAMFAGAILLVVAGAQEAQRGRSG